MFAMFMPKMEPVAMRWNLMLHVCVLTGLVGLAVGEAQEIPPPRVFVPSPPVPNPASSPAAAAQPTGEMAAPDAPPSLAPVGAEPEVPPGEAPAVVSPPPGGRGVGTGPPDAQFAA